MNNTTTLTPEQLEAAYGLMLSPTMGNLAALAHGMAADFQGPDAMRTALTTCVVEVIRSIDAGRIHCDTSVDRAMLHGLLVGCLETVNPGGLVRGSRETSNTRQ
jgi:hypothetical protein